MYYEGHGVPQNSEQAALWFRKAAELGLAVAQHNLGELYREGHGVPQNFAQAAAWYRKAAQQGHADAAAELEKLGEPVPDAGK